MKNRILPKVISNKLSQFEQKASVLVPTQKNEMSETFFVFFCENRSHALLCKEKCKRLVSEKCRATHNILKMLGFILCIFEFFVKKNKGSNV